MQTRREKHLKYECWAPSGIVSTSTSEPGRIDSSNLAAPAKSPIDAVRLLLSVAAAKPIIVFCMKKEETTRLAREIVGSGACAEQEQLSFEFLEMPETGAVVLLRESLVRRVAVHNADLTDEERGEVERKLLSGAIDVVFATSSLAAGVNFPFATAIMSSWERYDGASRSYKPIGAAEFHNMAGRAGRMGFEHEEGRVVFFPDKFGSTLKCSSYLDLAHLDTLEPRIDPSHFPQLVLQLVASGICDSLEELVGLVGHTFSGLREADRNADGFASWPSRIEAALTDLVSLGMVVVEFTGRLVATPVGKASAHSGLQPATSAFLLSSFVSFGDSLASWLPTSSSQGEVDSLLFTISRICFSSPEYYPRASGRQTRFSPWPLQKGYVAGVSTHVRRFNDSRLSSEPDVLNSAAVAVDWANGARLIDLEGRADALSAGMIRELIRNLAWLLQGVSAILEVATDSRVPLHLRPASVQIDDSQLKVLRKLPRFIGRIVRRLHEGLPEDVLWMLELNAVGQPFRLSREDVLRLQAAGMGSPMPMMSGDATTDAIRTSVFSNARPSPIAKSNWVRDRSRAWKVEQRRDAAGRQVTRARFCPARSLLDNYYGSLAFSLRWRSSRL